MKKALLAAILLAACLVPVGLTSPSNAACGGDQIKSGSIAMQPTDNSAYLITAKVRYQRCTSGALVLQYDILFDRQEGKCGTVRRWRGNPNIIGDWNPGTRETNCDDIRRHTIVWSPPPGLKVYAGDPASERCIGAYVTAVKDLMPDKTRDLPSLCVI